MAKNIKKNASGYNYKYTDLPNLNLWLENNNMDYYQYIEVVDGEDYVVTVPIIDGEEQPPRRGCRVVQATLSGKSNPAQEQGSAITYARRYSVLMAFGLACTDDDAECLSAYKEDKKPPKEAFKPNYKPTVEDVKKLLEETNSDTTAFLLVVSNHFKKEIKSIDEMDDKQLAYAYQRVMKKKEGNK